MVTIVTIVINLRNCVTTANLVRFNSPLMSTLDCIEISIFSCFSKCSFPIVKEKMFYM